MRRVLQSLQPDGQLRGSHPDARPERAGRPRPRLQLLGEDSRGGGAEGGDAEQGSKLESSP